MNSIRNSNFLIIATMITSLAMLIIGLVGTFTACPGCDASNHGGASEYVHDSMPLSAGIAMSVLGFLGLCGTVYALIRKYKK